MTSGDVTVSPNISCSWLYIVFTSGFVNSMLDVNQPSRSEDDRKLFEKTRMVENDIVSM